MGETDPVKKINALIDARYKSMRAKSITYSELQEKLVKAEKEIALESPELALYVKERFQAAMATEDVQMDIAAKGFLLEGSRRDSAVLAEICQAYAGAASGAESGK